MPLQEHWVVSVVVEGVAGTWRVSVLWAGAIDRTGRPFHGALLVLTSQACRTSGMTLLPPTSYLGVLV